ncbi:MAG: M42 family metallopeptidase, partial [Acetanaerobacterium sp.]
MLKLIKTLCELFGPSGMEDAVRARIIEEIDGHCEYRVDPLGNLIAFKKGEKTPKNKLLIAAHMDEVGFIITHAEESGLLRFACVGGIDTRVIVGKRLRVGECGICGVIGTKPVHLVKPDERDKMPEVDNLFIDIGARDREDALRLVAPGDCAVFDSDFVPFGDGLIKAKALDDRAGCAVMINLIQSPLACDTWFAFNVQEEVGCRGAVASAYSVAPDCAIVLETTTAADIAGVESGKEVCGLG